MKHLIFLLISFSCFSQKSPRKIDFNVGLNLGLNINKIVDYNPDSYIKDFKFSRALPQIGLNVRIKPKENFGLLTGINLVYRKSYTKNAKQVFYTDLYNVLIKSETHFVENGESEFNTLEIPVGFFVNILNKANYSLGVEGGFWIGFLQKGFIKYNYRKTWESGFNSRPDEISTVNLNTFNNTTNPLGVHFSIYSTHNNFSLKLTENIMQNEYQNYTNGNKNLTINNLTTGLSISYYLKKL